MRTRYSAVLIAVVLLTGVQVTARAQGVQTGTIRGSIQDQQGLALPGVTITATSPALQGPRTTVSDGEGNYTLAALPAGQYEVTFELSGFETVSKTATLAPTQTLPIDATLGPAALSLLSDYFPRRMRATSQSIYSSGIAIGGGLAFFLGATVVLVQAPA